MLYNFIITLYTSYVHYNVLVSSSVLSTVCCILYSTILIVILLFKKKNSIFSLSYCRLSEKGFANGSSVLPSSPPALEQDYSNKENE